MTTYTQTLADLRRSFIGWSVGLTLMIVALTSFYPSVRDMPDFASLMEQYPEALRELFNLTDFTAGDAYLNAELFTIMLPLLFGAFAVGKGARLFGGEEEAGLNEVLLTLPVPRYQLLVAKAAALVSAVAALGVVLFVELQVATLVTDMGVPTGELVAASAAIVLFGSEFGLLALAVGAATGSRVQAIAVAGTVGAASYVLYVLSRLVDALDGWEVLSPMEHLLHGGPLGTGWAIGSLMAMAVTGAVAIAIAGPILTNRDIGP